MINMESNTTTVVEKPVAQMADTGKVMEIETSAAPFGIRGRVPPKVRQLQRRSLGSSYRCLDMFLSVFRVHAWVWQSLFLGHSMLTKTASIFTIAGLASKATALDIPRDAMFSSISGAPHETDNSNIGDFGSRPQALHSIYRMSMVLLPKLIILAGLVCSLWILKAGEKPSGKQAFLWLMALGASISWWVTSATATGPSNGKSVSISTWFSLFAVYEATSYRALRDKKLHLFTSLLGGLSIAMVVGGITAQAFREALPGDIMEGFVRQAVIVGPTVMTIWSWCVTFVLRDRESKGVGQAAGLSGQDAGDVELGEWQA